MTEGKPASGVPRATRILVVEDDPSIRLGLEDTLTAKGYEVDAVGRGGEAADRAIDGRYDLVVGEEAWEADFFWHENPELKTSAFAWLTDFVGWLQMPAGGEREAFLTADYNAEMIEQVERYPRVRDRAIFVGWPEDIVPDRFGPGLPSIREWTQEHYDFSGYITGFDSAPLADRAALRLRLG